MNEISIILLLIAVCTTYCSSEKITPTSPDILKINDEYENPTIDDDKIDKRSADYELTPLDYDVNKRAYSYVTQFKRLPSYNFGLGKRSTEGYANNNEAGTDEGSVDREYLIKLLDMLSGDNDEGVDMMESDSKQRRQYGFGLGKRTITDLNDEDNAISNVEPEKRKDFSFGLGKRTKDFSFGLGKRSKHFDFGLGKRSRSFEFGLGKRTRSFEFGLGKRNLDNEKPQYTFSPEKRAPAFNTKRVRTSRYKFGIGKR